MAPVAGFRWRACRRGIGLKGKGLGRELARALAPLHSKVTARYWLELGRLFLLWSLAWACLVLLAARLVPWAGATFWAFAGAPVLLMVYGLFGWRNRPELEDVAAAADGLGLAERVVTALEVASGADTGTGTAMSRVLAPLVLDDALQRLGRLDLKRYPLLLDRRRWFHTGILALLLFSLVGLPNPMDAELARRAEERQAVAQAEARVEELLRRVQREEVLDRDTRGEEVRRILADLARDLEKAGDRREAADNLAETRDQLAQLLDRDRSSGRNGLGFLRDSWADSGLLAPLGTAVAAGDEIQAAQFLNDLAGKLASMDPVLLRELAGELQAAANLTRGDTELTEALRRAAVAAGTGAGDNGAQPAFEVLGEALQRAMAVAGASAEIRDLRSAIEQLARSLVSVSGGGLASGGPPGGTGIPGWSGSAGEGSGSGSPASGSGSGGNSGISGAGAAGGSGDGFGSDSGSGLSGGSGSGSGSGSDGGSGSGSGSGSGYGSGSGSGTGGGAGLGSTNRSGPSPGSGGGSSPGTGDPGDGLGYYEVIYDPELLSGQGPGSQVSGPASGGEGPEVMTPYSPVVPGALRPYTEIYGQYASRAMESLARQNLPPDLRELVRQYFAELNPGET